MGVDALARRVLIHDDLVLPDTRATWSIIRTGTQPCDTVWWLNNYGNMVNVSYTLLCVIYEVKLVVPLLTICPGLKNFRTFLLR